MSTYIYIHTYIHMYIKQGHGLANFVHTQKNEEFSHKHTHTRTQSSGYHLTFLFLFCFVAAVSGKVATSEEVSGNLIDMTTSTCAWAYVCMKWCSGRLLLLKKLEQFLLI